MCCRNPRPFQRGHGRIRRHGRSPLDPVLDRVFVNGDFVEWNCRYCSGGYAQGWGPWDPIEWFPDNLARYCFKTPGTQVFTAAIPVSSLNLVVLTYRYSINGQDNEPPGGRIM